MSLSLPTIILLTLTLITLTSSSVQYLVLKLFSQLCQVDQNQTISLYECQPKLIQHDKARGNYRNQQTYKMESFYLMNIYDKNNDQRLNKRETTEMAYAIVTGDVNERAVKIYWREHGPMKEKGEIIQEVQNSDQGDNAQVEL